MSTISELILMNRPESLIRQGRRSNFWKIFGRLRRKREGNDSEEYVTPIFRVEEQKKKTLKQTASRT
jgi:hypothetical protein